MFEQASREKFRFPTPQGLLSAEDLWDLPLTSRTGKANLDDIAKKLHAEIKESDGEVSFVTPATPKDKTLQTRFDIVKRVIEVRVQERDAAAEAEKRKERKQQIMALIQQKETEKLSATSLEDLQRMLAEV